MNMEMAQNGQEMPAVETMTDREIAEETLLRLRAFSQAMEALGSHPMVAAMMGG